MRVIAGVAGSLKLKTVSGLETRPTTDKTKETLFNILAPYICDAQFLDLFAGSGAIGIEALSRGAKNCVFIENNAKAVACIGDNLRFTKLEAVGNVIRGNVFNELERFDNAYGHFDIVFMDPPYNNGYEEKVLSILSGMKCIDDSTIIIVEASAETGFDYLDRLGFEAYRIKEYKTNKHVFITKKGNGETD